VLIGTFQQTMRVQRRIRRNVRNASMTRSVDWSLRNWRRFRSSPSSALENTPCDGPSCPPPASVSEWWREGRSGAKARVGVDARGWRKALLAQHPHPAPRSAALTRCHLESGLRSARTPQGEGSESRSPGPPNGLERVMKTHQVPEGWRGALPCFSVPLAPAISGPKRCQGRDRG
jgi:hypothetical protein